MGKKTLYVNEHFDAAPPRPPGKRVQNFTGQPSNAVSRIARWLLGVSLLLIFLLAACLVVMIVFYFQREAYLKEAHYQAMRIASSLSSEELQRNANLFDAPRPASNGKSVLNTLNQPQGQSIGDTPSSTRDPAGFQILRSLELIEAAVQSLQRKAKTCSTDRAKDSKCSNTPLDGWKQNGAFLYYFSTDIQNWNEAENFCIWHNSHLSSIGSKEEWTYLTLMKGIDNFWIGATARAGACSFVDGSVCGNLTFWDKLQPDNLVLSSGEQEQCVEMRLTGLWNDIVCSARLRWICKKSVCTE